MRCQECGQETDLKHLRQCQGEDCDDVLCAKCMEVHEMNHRHNDGERAANKYLDAGMVYANSLMFRRLPAAFLFLLLVAGTTVSLDVGMDGENIIDFNLPALGRVAAFMMIVVLTPAPLIIGPLKWLAGLWKQK